MLEQTPSRMFHHGTPLTPAVANLHYFREGTLVAKRVASTEAMITWEAFSASNGISTHKGMMKLK